MKNRQTTPTSLDALDARVRALEGKTLGHLADGIGLALPTQLLSHKGLAGQLIEHLLGADAGNQAKPDFLNLGIELKTIPVNAALKPKESTYVCTVSLHPRPYERYETSVVHAKLSHVLWVPILAQAPAVSDWQVLKAVFWQPSAEEAHILRTDFEELMEAIALGGLEQITSRRGDALHIRPKAADGKQLTTFIGAQGAREHTLPRGFYLRTSFTGRIIMPA